jgi:hypothetical protein
MTRSHIGLFARWALVLLLGAAASAKVVAVIDSGGIDGNDVLYLTAAAIEVALCVMLTVRRRVRFGALLCMSGFLGAGAVTLVRTMVDSQATCRCLGVWQTRLDLALLVQGFIVLAAGTLRAGLAKASHDGRAD